MSTEGAWDGEVDERETGISAGQYLFASRYRSQTMTARATMNIRNPVLDTVAKNTRRRSTG